MKKHLIIGQFGSQDSISDPSFPDEKATLFPLTTGSNDSMAFNVNSLLQELYAINIYPSEIGIDFMILAAHVFAADTRLSRRSESQDSWTREIRLIVPVSNAELWRKCSPILNQQLKFLTGDFWKVEFRTRPSSHNQLVLQRPQNSQAPQHDKLQLFSGGLDSLIGTIDNLENGSSPLLISHAGDGATSNAQDDCYAFLKTKYPTKTFERLRVWLNISSKMFLDIPVESTTRGRSFLFFSLGIFAGTGLNRHFTLEAPENGLIALNVPMDILRLGALSTHTTHPFYIEGWNTILSILGVDGVVKNPYWSQTKGEMVDNCKNSVVLQEILKQTLSCSSPAKGRWKGLSVQHCGYCLPCLIRRASLFNRRSITDDTVYTIPALRTYTFNSMLPEGHQIRSFQHAAYKLLRRPSLASILIHKSGPLKDINNLPAFADVYLRGMREVNNLLTGVVSQPQS